MRELFSQKWLQLSLIGLLALFLGFAAGYWSGVNSVALWQERKVQADLFSRPVHTGVIKSLHDKGFTLEVNWLPKNGAGVAIEKKQLAMELADDYEVLVRQSDDQALYGPVYEQWQRLQTELASTTLDAQESRRLHTEAAKIKVELDKQLNQKIIELNRKLRELSTDQADYSQQQQTLQEQLDFLQRRYRLVKADWSQVKEGGLVTVLMENGKVKRIEIVK